MTRCRKNVAQLTPTEKSQLVQAFLDLKDPVKSPSKIPAAAAAVTAKGGTPNRYDDYVWMHNQVGFGAHRGPAFGPWHREFLYQLEHDLGLAAGDPDLALPYWDWINARDSSSPGWPFTNDLMGGFGDLGPGATTGFVGAGPFSNPATWRMNVRLSGDNDTTLKRSRGVPAASALPARSTVLRMFGIGIGPGVTWPTVYDGTPLNDSNTNPTSTQVFSSLRKYLERFLHDGVHGWVGDAWELDAQGNPHDGGHMSFPSVSVNDPVFFLHHCNVDRLWSIWQRKVGGAYIPQSGGPGGHNGGDLMVNLADPTWFNAPLHAHPNDVADHQALGYWYHTDQPDITLDTPSVAFGSVPELTTTFMPVMFTIRTCQPVRFEVTAVTGSGFAVAAGQGIVIVDDDHDSDTVTGRVYVQYTANGALNTPVPGTATVVASIVDTDGYDTANPGDVLVLGSWTVDLTATSVSRPKAAIGLVLDRSGSMSLSAGVAGSRYDMLKASLNVLRDVMRPIDGVAVVTFDDVTSTLNPVLALGPAVDPAGPGTGRAALDTAIASPDLVPRNMTGIGQGLIDAAAVLDTERLDPSTPYQRFALCVMTDGNENVDPKVADPLVTAAIAPYADAIYAIGLGQPGGVSDAVLTSISNYMLITGDITAAERRFRLTKYFIQILAGVTRTAIVVDPQGDLAVGSEHRIPFVLHDSDLEVDVIVLSPLAPLIEFSLVAPDGTEIDAGFGAPTVEFHEHQEDAFYRLTVPVAPTVPRAGRWTAVLRLSKEAMTKADGRDDWREVLQQLARHGTLPYSLIVQSYSDLLLDVAVKPSLCLAGETVALAATLTANGQPLEDLASVTVAVTDPNGKEFRVRLSGDGRGGFTGSMVAAVPGAYSCRFVASGGRGRIATFQREETRTVVAYRGEFPPGVGDPADDKQQKRVVHPRPAGRIELLARPVADVALRPARQLRRERDMPDHQMADHPDDDQAGAGAAAGAAEVHDHGAADEHDEHGDHGGHAGMDHERMVFTVFRPVGEDGIEELRADEIERDPSGYDEDGRDTGVGPDRVPPPEPGEHDHHH